MRKVAIRRPGGPAGVGPMDSAWGRTLALRSIGPTRRLTPAAAAVPEPSWQSLLTNAHANSHHDSTRGQS